MKDTVIPSFKPATTGGIYVHEIGVSHHDVYIPHHEEVYLLFLLRKGHCSLEINGQPLPVTTPSFAFVHPGQVHVLKEAKRILYYTDLHIREIAYELGFEDHTFFSRFFMKHTSTTPLLFRNKFRQ